MTIERTDRTVVTEGPTALTGQQTAADDDIEVRPDLRRVSDATAGRLDVVESAF